MKLNFESRLIAALALVLALGLHSVAGAVTISPGPSTDPWLGYMNVSELDMTYLWGSSWGVPDLVADFDDPGNKLTLEPNQINDPDPYWYIGGGGPGAPGNKIMEANLYIEQPDDALAGQTVEFSYNVLSNSLTSAHSAIAFIKDFAPDYSSFNQVTAPLTPGANTISLATDAGLGRHVQWGFQMTGVNVWPGDEGPFGNVVIATIPEPTTLALCGLGLAGLFVRRKHS